MPPTKSIAKWQPDNSTTQCTACDGAFTVFFKRRHHCRLCGYIFCDKCSTGRRVLRVLHPTKLQRLCSPCFVGKPQSHHKEKNEERTEEKMQAQQQEEAAVVAEVSSTPAVVVAAPEMYHGQQQEQQQEQEEEQEQEQEQEAVCVEEPEPEEAEQTIAVTTSAVAAEPCADEAEVEDACAIVVTAASQERQHSSEREEYNHSARSDDGTGTFRSCASRSSECDSTTTSRCSSSANNNYNNSVDNAGGSCYYYSCCGSTCHSNRTTPAVSMSRQDDDDGDQHNIRIQSLHSSMTRGARSGGLRARTSVNINADDVSNNLKTPRAAGGWGGNLTPRTPTTTPSPSLHLQMPAVDFAAMYQKCAVACAKGCWVHKQRREHSSARSSMRSPRVFEEQQQQQQQPIVALLTWKQRFLWVHDSKYMCFADNVSQQSEEGRDADTALSAIPTLRLPLARIQAAAVSRSQLKKASAASSQCGLRVVSTNDNGSGNSKEFWFAFETQSVRDSFLFFINAFHKVHAEEEEEEDNSGDDVFNASLSSIDAEEEEDGEDFCNGNNNSDVQLSARSCYGRSSCSVTPRVSFNNKTDSCGLLTGENF